MRLISLTVRDHFFYEKAVALINVRFISSNSKKSAENKSNERAQDPWLAGRTLWRHDPNDEIPQAWVTSFHSGEKQGLIDLHPSIWRVNPRLDILNENIRWQETYRNLVYTKALTRAEISGSNRKPWPQTKSGRAHHGSRKSPHFMGGGIPNGLRGPLTYFYMLSDNIRLKGLCTALTLKHVQNDIVIVDSLEDFPLDHHICVKEPKTEPDDMPISAAEPERSLILHQIADDRNWGYSVLFVNKTDAAPFDLARACVDIPSFNILPVYGLNCNSLVKHDTLVITTEAVLHLEGKLLSHLHRPRPLCEKFRYKDYKERILREAGEEYTPYAEEHPPFI